MIFTRNFTSIALGLTLTTSTALADAGSTKVLEEYFSYIENTPVGI